MTLEGPRPSDVPVRRPFDLKSMDQTRELVSSLSEIFTGWNHKNPQNDELPFEQHFFTFNKIRPTDGVISSRFAVTIDKPSGLIAYLSVTDIGPKEEGDLGNRDHFVLIPKSATIMKRQEGVYLDFVGTQQGKDALVRVDSNGNMKGEIL